MLTFPNCKINLGLQIIKKRTDGFHELSSCMYPVQWCDVLEVIESDSFAFSQSGRSIPGNPENNLCVKAFKLLEKETGIHSVKMHLQKVLPDGAGLGGGSADGAFALKLLNDKFELKLTTRKLEELAAQLGSDCPFFIQNEPAMIAGRGESITPLDCSLKGLQIAVVFPDQKVSTADAFGGIKPQKPEIDISEILKTPIELWRKNLKNDFESTIFQKYPALENVKTELYQQGAIYASMSGSGSAFYGIFKEKNTIRFPENYTVWQGELT